eukprot:scaffold49683_cov37-Prasinocladus_malaysianus.AAC.4
MPVLLKKPLEDVKRQPFLGHKIRITWQLIRIACSIGLERPCVRQTFSNDQYMYTVIQTRHQA